MTISKSHYHRNRLLRERIRRGDSQLQRHTSTPAPADSEPDEGIALPEYFREAAESSEESPSPIVILWDEVA
ncbi:MAG: hypothetical protein HWE39_01275 [Oceanospirillaceae bacterium]|nr:hypothetical protein [Oceanospirillaceae bacterium]